MVTLPNITTIGLVVILCLWVMGVKGASPWTSGGRSARSRGAWVEIISGHLAGLPRRPFGAPRNDRGWP